MRECYKYIIGLAEDDCACKATGRPADYNTSNSGLFLDQLSPIGSLTSSGECGTDIWKMMQSALNVGVTKVVADTNALLSKRFTVKRAHAVDQVLGEIKGDTVHSSSKNYSVTRMVCAPVRSGYMKLKDIGAIFSGTGTTVLRVYNNVEGHLFDMTLNTAANKHTTNAVPTANIELPLHSKYVSNLEYYFVYQYDAINMPRQNKLSCGCGGWTPHFNLGSPYFLEVGRHRAAPWSEYVMTGTTEINSLTELDDLDSVCSNNMNGLTFNVDFGCKVNEVVCKDSLDFEGNMLALSLALSVQYASAVSLADKVQKSDILSRTNMLQADDWEEAALEWDLKYQQQIEYIVDNVSHTGNDCLSCKSFMKMTGQGILA